MNDEREAQLVGGTSRMARESDEAPAAVARQTALIAPALAALTRRLRSRRPRLVVTCARGSSAHAATFGKHLIERYLGLPVAAAAPSIATVYRRDLALEGQLVLAVSQSGRSDDLVEFCRSARRAGALTVALVNEAESPLAEACDTALPLAAGPERAVPATKSFIASLAALLHLVARWADEERLARSVERLPERLAAAQRLDWSAALPALSGAESLVTVGRGPTLAIAREAALKLKETCDLHAEAFSGAEFRHGPIALIRRSYPVLVFKPGDESDASLDPLVADLTAQQARLYVTEPERGPWPTLPPDEPEADAILQIASFYPLVERLSRQKGIDTDQPRHLAKVTRTR
jgi:glutamine---fructose-6-phosphate transaminase (isomerizing)